MLKKILRHVNKLIEKKINMIIDEENKKSLKNKFNIKDFQNNSSAHLILEYSRDLDRYLHRVYFLSGILFVFVKRGQSWECIERINTTNMHPAISLSLSDFTFLKAYLAQKS